MATDLANYTRSAVKVHGTKITAGASLNPVTAAHATILSGTLRDVTSHTPLGGRVVWIEGFLGSNPNPVFIRLHTGRKGALGVKKLTQQADHEEVPVARRLRRRAGPPPGGQPGAHAQGRLAETRPVPGLPGTGRKLRP